MNTFNVNVKIKDCIFGKCCSSSKEKDINLTNSTQTISLQNNYILNVVLVTSTYSTVIIQNGFQVIIRNIRNYPMQICIPTKNCQHLVTVSITNLA